MLRIAGFYPTTALIDGETIRLRITRFTKDDDLWFNPTFERVGRDQAATSSEVIDFALKYRQRMAAEQGVPLEKIDLLDPLVAEGLFEATLTPDAKQARRAEEDRRIREGTEFCHESIRRYVTVEPGQIYDEARSRDVVNGEDLVRVFEGRPDVLVQLQALIRIENRLTAEQKKRLWSQPGSPTSSPASSPAAGPTPDATVGSAASAGSAGNGHAPVRRPRKRSGGTTKSSASSVPS